MIYHHKIENWTVRRTKKTVFRNIKRVKNMITDFFSSSFDKLIIKQVQNKRLHENSHNYYSSVKFFRGYKDKKSCDTK